LFVVDVVVVIRPATAAQIHSSIHPSIHPPTPPPTPPKTPHSEELVKDYSQPLVIARPEILVREMTEQDDFVLLACDGLFDVFSNQEVVRFILDEMRQHHDAQRACENLSYTAIHQRIAHGALGAITKTCLVSCVLVVCYDRKAEHTPTTNPSQPFYNPSIYFNQTT